MKDWYWTNRDRQADIQQLEKKNKLFKVLYKLNLMKHEEAYGYGNELTILEIIQGLYHAIRWHNKGRECFWAGIDQEHWFSFHSTHYDGTEVSLTFCKIWIGWIF